MSEPSEKALKILEMFSCGTTCREECETSRHVLRRSTRVNSVYVELAEAIDALVQEAVEACAEKLEEVAARWDVAAETAKTSSYSLQCEVRAEELRRHAAWIRARKEDEKKP